jgi:hypothetical protein
MQRSERSHGPNCRDMGLSDSALRRATDEVLLVKLILTGWHLHDSREPSTVHFYRGDQRGDRTVPVYWKSLPEHETNALLPHI